MQTSRRLNAEENDQDKTLLGLSRFTANVQLDPQCSATGSGGTRWLCSHTRIHLREREDRFWQPSLSLE
ncbi:hypothetical protein KC332_g29 [Hortaea werneckii]|nr:hypothetical protein KC332_g29 [Hortaea werneckii]